MNYRKDLINYFVKKFNYTSYLEIGVNTPHKTFNHILCSAKEGVDPNGCSTHKMTSDKFFESTPSDKKWDIIFVDGDHNREQVKKDILNSLDHLNDNGIIVCHDVNPQQKSLLSSSACGSAWEAFAELRGTRNDLIMYGMTFDHLGFIHKGTQVCFDKEITYSWEFLDMNRKELMNELTLDEFYKLYPIN
jgi:hypothetical protein